jgi:hypothetical protein
LTHLRRHKEQNLKCNFINRTNCYDPYKNGLIIDEKEFKPEIENNTKNQPNNSLFQKNSDFNQNTNQRNFSNFNPSSLGSNRQQLFKETVQIRNPLINANPSGSMPSSRYGMNTQNPYYLLQMQTTLTQHLLNSLLIQNHIFANHFQNNLGAFHYNFMMNNTQNLPPQNINRYSLFNPMMNGQNQNSFNLPMNEVNQQLFKKQTSGNPFNVNQGTPNFFDMSKSQMLGTDYKANMEMNRGYANQLTPMNKKQIFKSSKKSKDKFAKLENLLKKIFLMENIKTQDLELDSLEKWIFEQVIEKKKYFLICGIVWKDSNFFDELKSSTTPKRNEEKLKYVFKMTQKKMKKKFFQNYYNYCNECQDLEAKDRLRSDKEFAFFHYYFSKYCKENSISLDKIIQASGNDRTDMEKVKKRSTKAIKSVNRDYLRMIKKNDKFMLEFKKYILFEHDDITRVEDTHNSIIGDSQKTIQKKIENKIVEWTTMWYNSDKRNDEFKQVIKNDFNKKKYKLPWTMVDVYSAVDEVKQIIREEADDYIPENFE